MKSKYADNADGTDFLVINVFTDNFAIIIHQFDTSN